MGSRSERFKPAFGTAVLLLALVSACHRASPTNVDDPSVREAGNTVGVAATVNVMDDFEREEVSGRAEAKRPIATMRPECMGFIGDDPDVYLHVAKDRVLRLQAAPTDDANADLVMAVMSNSGTVLCSDDADGINPRIEASFAPGQYRVWIGAFEQEKSHAFTLSVDDVLKDLPEGPAPTTSQDGAFGGLIVRPDSGPGTLRGRGGGTREANTLGPGCVGFIGMRPDHVLTLENAMRLRISARATDADLVLLLQDSQGRVLCNDDADGRNPALFEEMNAGTWNVYVGSYAPSHYPEYVLRVSR